MKAAFPMKAKQVKLTSEITCFASQFKLFPKKPQWGGKNTRKEPKGIYNELALAPQGNEIHLRPRTKTKRDSATYTWRHMQHLSVLHVSPAPFIISPTGRRPASYSQLSRMGMARKGKLDVCLAGNLTPPMGRIVEAIWAASRFMI